MLLAGIRETVLDGGPTELTNVVRAALGQIEGFQRVGLRADTEIMVEPDIIGDLTLMVAELLENAVSFSPRGQPRRGGRPHRRRRRADRRGRPRSRHERRPHRRGERPG